MPEKIKEYAVHEKRKERFTALLHILVLFLCTGIVYGHTLPYPFVFDDETILANLSLRKLTSFSQIFAEGFSRSFVRLTFSLNFVLAGDSPFFFRLVNVVLHGLNATLVYSVIRSFGGDFAQSHSMFRKVRYENFALFVAAIWAVHPLNTQAITYIVQRYESMMAFWSLMTIQVVLWSSGAKSILMRAIGWTGSACTFLLGMASKEVAIAVLPILVLIDYARLGLTLREYLAKRRFRLIVFACMALGSVPLLLQFAKGDGRSAGLTLERVNSFSYCATQCEVTLYYIRLFAFPYPQCFDYGWRIETSSVAIALSLMAHLVLVVGILRYFAFNSVAFLVVGAWYLVLSPTSSFIPLIDAAVEHRNYLSNVSLSIGLVYSLVAICKVLDREVFFRWIALSLVGIFASLAWLRNETYSSNVRLWSDVYAAITDGSLNHSFPNRIANNLGVALTAEGDFVLANEVFRRGLVDAPNDPYLHENLGRNLIFENRVEEANNVLEIFDRTEFDYPSAYCVASYTAALLGDADLTKARVRKALKFANRTISDDILLANACLLSGDFSNGKSVFSKLCKSTGVSRNVYLQFIELLVESGDPVSARAVLAKLKQLAPGSREFALAEGWCLYGEKRYDQALNLMESSVVASASPGRDYLRAKALHSLGKKSQAISAYIEELRISPNNEKALLELAVLELDYNAKSAIDRLRVVLSLRPRHRPAAVLLARALVASGEPEAAIHWLEEFQNDAGASDELRVVLEKLRQQMLEGKR